MKLKPVYILGLIIMALFSCNNENKVEDAISKIELNVDVERFDKQLANTSVNQLSELKDRFPFLFPKQIDSVWIDRFKSDVQQEVFHEVLSKYEDFSGEEQALEDFFKHLKYYDSNFKSPRVITVADYVDYRNKLVLQANLLLINLANYLGSNHQFYQNIPAYFSKNMKPTQIVVDVAHKYAESYAYQDQRKTFLDEIIYQGKLLYFKDVMMPNAPNFEKIGYTEQDMKWAEVNEPMIWSFFVENETLFSTDPKLYQRFTVPGPFSKFGLEIDNESPPRLGSYIGWQIVKSYANRTDKSVLEIMRTNTDEIFKISKYKPKR